MDNNQDNEQEVKQESKNERNIRNNENNIRNAADVAIASGNAWAMAAGKIVKTADKVSGGRSTTKLAKQLNTANKISPGGRSIQRKLNKASESGASDMAGNIASKKNAIKGNTENKKDALNNTNNNEKINSNDTSSKDNNIFSSDKKSFSKNKTKLIIWLIAFFGLCCIFICTIIAPLISLGIIDIGSSDESNSESLVYANYSSVKDSTSYWWPIGGTEAVTKNGETFTTGDPYPTVITSHFSTRDDPFNGQESFHSGIDIASSDGSYGAYIIAARDGTVTYPNSDSPTNCVSNGNEDPCGGGYGNYVMIEHSDGSITVYAHMYENSITVHSGDQVSQGQVIGKMGSSGRSNGSHLHFEVRVNGKQVNPLNYVSEDNPYPSKGSSSYINASDVKQSICKSLKNKNYSDVGTAAILTNMYYESSFDPTATGDGETSYGLCQWHESRYDNLKSSYPTNYHTPEAQFNYLIYELENSYSSLNKSLLEDTSSAEDLTYNFCATFENPYDTEKTCKNRGSNSAEYLTYVKNDCN